METHTIITNLTNLMIMAKNRPSIIISAIRNGELMFKSNGEFAH